MTSHRPRQETVAAPNLSLKKPYLAGELVAGKYVLKELLGTGGMGAVWRAHNQTLEIDVALKLIRVEETQSREGPLLEDRLLQEARAAARLGHPAIARVFDFGTSDRDDPYIVMELLRGEDLAQALARRGRLSATKAVSILMPIVHALAAAHGKGIVHRDLKPENIFLSRAEDGRTQPKLVDFGIAKMDRAKSGRLTQTGTMLGSPIYMSPEQARGDDVDHLADVWALSVVLYEMITGRPPFEGKNYNALLYSIIADKPAPVTSFGAGDAELWGILERGLKKDPDRRWPSMRQLGTALARWMIARGATEDITGSSLSAQWLRTLKPTGDVLASMLPSEAPPSDREAVESVSMRSRRRGLAALRHLLGMFRENSGRRNVALLALASIILGAAGVVLLVTVFTADDSEISQQVSAEPAAVAARQPPPAKLSPELLEAARAAPSSVQPAARASAEAAIPSATSRASQGAKPKRARRYPRRARLKNPFQ